MCSNTHVCSSCFVLCIYCSIFFWFSTNTRWASLICSVVSFKSGLSFSSLCWICPSLSFVSSLNLCSSVSFAWAVPCDSLIFFSTSCISASRLIVISMLCLLCSSISLSSFLNSSSDLSILSSSFSLSCLNSSNHLVVSPSSSVGSPFCNLGSSESSISRILCKTTSSERFSALCPSDSLVGCSLTGLISGCGDDGQDASSARFGSVVRCFGISISG